MRRKIQKRTVVLVIVLAACAAAGLAGFRLRNGRSGSSPDGENTAYVEKVSVLTGNADGSGMVNRFSGVVESQDTWSVEQKADSTVKEVLVTVGQNVKKGDPLFTYDTDKYNDNLAQAQIDLERLNNEKDSINTTIAELQKQQKKAKAAEQANYTIQIQEQQLAEKQKELDIQSKQADIDKLNDNIAHATVTSEIDGVVKNIRNGTANAGDSLSGTQDNSFITVMKSGDYRIKGSINEQNISQIAEGSPMLAVSRTDSSKTWRGTVSKIDTSNPSSGQNNGMSSDMASGSSSYPFYVDLDSSDGLIMGQHVYLEPDVGQTGKKDGLWVPEYMVDETDAENPFVWADKDGKLTKLAVTLGGRDENLGTVEILSGLSESDSIAFPDSSLKEGMRTAPMADMPADMSVVSGSGTDMENVFSSSAGEEVYGSSVYNDYGTREVRGTDTGTEGAENNAGQMSGAGETGSADTEAAG